MAARNSSTWSSRPSSPSTCGRGQPQSQARAICCPSSRGEGSRFAWGCYQALTIRSRRIRPTEFRLLGPVQIWSGTGPIDLKRRPERLLLAVLLLEPGKPIPAERLIELLWPDALPANPRRALQVYVSRLRAVLDVELTSGRGGYAIQSMPGQTDVEQFRSLVEQARRQDDLEQRSKLLMDALALWRGPALADVTTEDVRRRLCRGLDEARLAAQELRLSTELALGHHQELLAELADLTAAEPARETFAAAHMLALYRSGRQADALSAYADLVRHLDEELGVAPGAEVRDLQVAILRQDSSLDLASIASVPRELPADIGLLLGRDDVLEETAEVLLREGRPAYRPSCVCTVQPVPESPRLRSASGTGLLTTTRMASCSYGCRKSRGKPYLRARSWTGC